MLDLEEASFHIIEGFLEILLILCNTELLLLDIVAKVVILRPFHIEFLNLTELLLEVCEHLLGFVHDLVV